MTAAAAAVYIHVEASVGGAMLSHFQLDMQKMTAANDALIRVLRDSKLAPSLPTKRLSSSVRRAAVSADDAVYLGAWLAVK
ncbi:uncharacterized protein CCOS01_00580 [Colletotrichum costaricense]|uniref:Uncharacterized protein n=1 Tax=Colletotrichum costaricense TaxID=1209916 RepID=A0AAJ0E7A3_9PEZI|nr:uncharacterized protein CCOS01_00580 [Colletotrichum costaricense]KAK1539266.1 hypothetical protein CCOS01_00580 [Colletotrichum costaricense]